MEARPGAGRDLLLGRRDKVGGVQPRCLAAPPAGRGAAEGGLPLGRFGRVLYRRRDDPGAAQCGRAVRARLAGGAVPAQPHDLPRAARRRGGLSRLPGAARHRHQRRLPRVDDRPAGVASRRGVQLVGVGGWQARRPCPRVAALGYWWRGGRQPAARALLHRQALLETAAGERAGAGRAAPERADRRSADGPHSPPPRRPDLGRALAGHRGGDRLRARVAARPRRLHPRSKGLERGHRHDDRDPRRCRRLSDVCRRPAEPAARAPAEGARGRRRANREGRSRDLAAAVARPGRRCRDGRGTTARRRLGRGCRGLGGAARRRRPVVVLDRVRARCGSATCRPPSTRKGSRTCAAT